MFGSGNNPFDPAKFSELFTSMDMSKFFDVSAYKGFDQSALFDAQQKNMDALVAAQQSAAAGYQDLFQKQVAIFQDTMKAAQSQLSELSKTDMGADSAAKHAELTTKAFETAVANARDLAEAAQKANEEAFNIVRSRVEASIEELKGAVSK
ncbi:MAG: TIGR01841 family phasin [Pseudomonadota bacterium]